MHIYINKEEAEKLGLIEKTKEGSSKIFGEYFLDGANPHISVSWGKDPMVKISQITEVFEGASRIEGIKLLENRELGMYKLGDATLELLFSSSKDYTYEARIRTNSIDGISHMERLFVLVKAGMVYPVLSYDKKQGEQNLLGVMKELLAQKSLSPIKRFCYALRLMRA